MAEIVLTDAAPTDDGTILFGLATGSFELDSGGSFKTDDRALLGEAEVHPWLEVKYDDAEVSQPTFRESSSVAPEDDVLSAQNSKATAEGEPDPEPEPAAKTPFSRSTEDND